MRTNRPEETNDAEKLRRPIFNTRLLVGSIVLAMIGAIAVFTAGAWAQEGTATTVQTSDKSHPQEWKPLVPVAATLVVDDDNVQCPAATFSTIQAAVTAASSGDTIQVCAGTYNENVSITKSLTLLGAQSGVDARGRSAAESIVTPAAPGTATFTIAFSGLITVDGFSFVGGSAGVQGCIYTNVGPNNNMQIVNNRFSGYSTQAIWLNRGGTDMTIDKNVMDGSNIASGSQAIFFNGPQDYSGLYFTNNQVINNTNRAGIFVDGTNNIKESATRAPLIDGNLFDKNNVGMNLGRASFGSAGAPVLGAYAGTISNNIFSNNAFDGIQGGLQHVLVTRNKFTSNGRNGIGLSCVTSCAAGRGAHDTDITCNEFSGNGFLNSGAALALSSTQTAGTIATNKINTNNITGNNVGLTYAGSEVIDAKNDWWGSATGPTIASNPGGTGDTIVNASNSVVYSPFLTAPSACVPPCATSANNVALPINGGSATASSEITPNFPASGVINGEHDGNDWGSGGGWADSTFAAFPDNVDVAFSSAQTLGEIDVYTLKDGPNDASTVNDATIFTQYGITDFEVQTSNSGAGGPFVTVPGGNVTGNNNVKRKFSFAAPITATNVRVLVHASADGAAPRRRAG